MTLWQKLPAPFIGLAPMDGYTDAAFRHVVDISSRPDLMYTEFVAVEAIKAGAIGALTAFIRHETKTPIIAQIYGVDLEGFYVSTLVLLALGYRAIDINMGCPAKSVASRGAGAGLIINPPLASAIIQKVKDAIHDFQEDADVALSHIPFRLSEFVKTQSKVVDTSLMPAISAKTRIGYDSNVAVEWLTHLASQNLDAIAIHGRTLKQGYKGVADWDTIASGAKIIKHINPHTKVLGSGDITSYEQGQKHIKTHGVDGVLIGRASVGNPWIFGSHPPTIEKQKETILKHADLLYTTYPQIPFITIRKHLVAYCKGVPHASDFRRRCVLVKTPQDVEDALQTI